MRNKLFLASTLTCVISAMEETVPAQQAIVKTGNTAESRIWNIRQGEHPPKSNKRTRTTDEKQYHPGDLIAGIAATELEQQGLLLNVPQEGLDTSLFEKKLSIRSKEPLYWHWLSVKHHANRLNKSLN